MGGKDKGGKKKKVGRNSMCPCGSGRKQKMCCGRNGGAGGAGGGGAGVAGVARTQVATNVPSMTREVLETVAYGDTAAVQQLIESGLDVNAE